MGCLHDLVKTDYLHSEKMRKCCQCVAGAGLRRGAMRHCQAVYDEVVPKDEEGNDEEDNHEEGDGEGDGDGRTSNDRRDVQHSYQHHLEASIFNNF